MIHFAIFGLLIANEVEEWNEGLASQLVDQLALPEEHDVTLHLDCFFLYSSNQRNMGQHLVQKQRKNSGVMAGADIVEGR